MINDNPHENNVNLAATDHNVMHSVFRVIAIVFCSAILTGIAGLTIGAALGMFVPEYYCTVFANGADPGFDPVTVGIGQGMTQGLALGALIGMVSVVISFWRKSLALRSENQRADVGRRWSYGLLAAVALFSGLCVGVPAYGIGFFYSKFHSDVVRGNRDVDRVNDIIAADSDRFGHLRINRGPADKFLVQGSVKTEADRDLLRDRLIREFGENRTDGVLAVEIQEPE